MIIVKLQGGLGNQMFQVAAGIALSSYFKTILKLDVAFLLENNIPSTTFTPRRLAVDVFDRNIAIASERERGLFLNTGKKIPDLLQSSIKKLIYKPEIVKDNWTFRSLPERSSLNTYLDGFWQSEKYFNGYEKEVRSFYSFPEILLQFTWYARMIENTNSVAVHFRRGDYINNEHIKSIHNVCDTAYYNRAINYLSGKYSDLKFFLFSDEPEWLTANFISERDCEIVKTDSDITDMHLMSLCKHNIIANSSFSWWGAWLNNNPGKTVVAPERWFATDIADDKDIVPDSWIKI